MTGVFGAFVRAVDDGRVHGVLHIEAVSLHLLYHFVLHGFHALQCHRVAPVFQIADGHFTDGHRPFPVPLVRKEMVGPVNEYLVLDGGVKDSHLTVLRHGRYQAFLQAEVKLTALQHHVHRFVTFFFGGFQEYVFPELSLRRAFLELAGVVLVVVVIALHGQEDTA